MSNLTIEDLAALINQAPKAKKPRKKTEQTPEQRELMLEKLALMREKSLEKRNAKKAEVKPEPQVVEPKAKPQPKAQPQVQAPPPQPVQPNNDLFEKHYNSKFDKLEDSINSINNSINQMKQLKLEKAELKRKKAEEKAQQEEKTKELKEEGLSQVKTQSQGDVVQQPTPPQNLNPNRIMRPNTNYKSFFKR